ncbi:hypothetical protein [Paractinoplanes toevensis]|uniref:Uncharacterized protein n=1 Tax=Paractinoplanes toevensis TaxID=571911 RepID=A0A919T804_9ACTN|nr:hypothetical protein [Actinoplanes toevensis]GIM89761.1 hypothetical protein Ato02nite_015540 [Actinoplanes toevensis]
MRAALIATGTLVIAYGMVGAVADDPAGIGVFLIAVLVGHDALWMPVVLAGGFLITRFVPARRRGAVRITALIAAALCVVTLPLVLGLGRPADNPSVLPLHYGRHLAVILLVLALGPAVRAMIRKKFERPAVRGTDPGGE